MSGTGMKVDFSRSLDDIVAANKAYLKAYEDKNNVDATRLSVEIDPNQLVLVVVVRNTGTGEVCQATQYRLSVEGK